MKKKKPIPNQPGICKNCGSNNISYGSSEIFGDQIGYEYDCDECHFTGYEIYDLIFVGHEER